MIITGHVARIVVDKGFGFILREGGTEYFFHRSDVVGAPFDELREGLLVTFEERNTTKGPRAALVSVKK